MSISLIDRRSLRIIDRKCDRLEREMATLYHRAVQIKMPLETLSAVACLARDIAAIHNRIVAMRFATGGAP
jgi:hypothetical protein